jgi:hypothetical protein
VLFGTKQKKQKPEKKSKAGGNISKGLLITKPQENYAPIAQRIKSAKGKCKSILFASVKLQALPVTIPVNVTIELTRGKKCCLLVDLDLERDAIAKVFELNGQKTGLRPKAVQTKLENIWVLPGHDFVRLKQMNIKMIVQNALDKFDLVLMNAPSLTSNPDRRQIISAAQAAFTCAKDASEATKLTELIKPSTCRVIGNIQIP